MERRTRRFVITEKGQKTGILLSLKEYESLIEDLRDLAIIAERKDESSGPLSAVKEKLLRQWYFSSLYQKSTRKIETGSTANHPFAFSLLILYNN